MISAAVSGGLLDGFKVGNATFSHLVFVNDALFFAMLLLSCAVFEVSFFFFFLPWALRLIWPIHI
jgi:hypothetical protein